MFPSLPHTLLIVEDSRPVRMLLRTIFEGAGATVIEAEHGEQALRMIEINRGIDAVVTDLAMPTMDGIELIDTLRERFGSELPIVVCSAAVLQAQRLVESGLVSSAVSKPFSPHQLVREVATALHAPTMAHAAV